MARTPVRTPLVTKMKMATKQTNDRKVLKVRPKGRLKEGIMMKRMKTMMTQWMATPLRRTQKAEARVLRPQRRACSSPSFPKTLHLPCHYIPLPAKLPSTILPTFLQAPIPIFHQFLLSTITIPPILLILKATLACLLHRRDITMESPSDQMNIHSILKTSDRTRHLPTPRTFSCTHPVTLACLCSHSCLNDCLTSCSRRIRRVGARMRCLTLTASLLAWIRSTRVSCHGGLSSDPLTDHHHYHHTQVAPVTPK